MEGLATVQARIASIESRIAAMSNRAPAATSSGAAGSAGASSFESALSSALGKAGAVAGAGGLTPAQRLAPGQYGRLEPPAELRAYGNGRIPPDALAPLGIGSHRLWAPAGASFQQLAAAAAADGVTIGVTDSYRSYEAQVRLAEEKGLYENGGLAARPGTSNHGWGLSLDLDLDDRAQAWMREHGWKYGFVEDVPREPWHWTYRPAT